MEESATTKQNSRNIYGNVSRGTGGSAKDIEVEKITRKLFRNCRQTNCEGLDLVSVVFARNALNVWRERHSLISEIAITQITCPNVQLKSVE